MNSSVFLHSELPLKLETSQLISGLWQLESVGWTEQNQTELVRDETREVILQVSQIICSLTGCRNTLQMLINDIFCKCSDFWLLNINNSKWRRKIFWQKQQTNFWQLPSKANGKFTSLFIQTCQLNRHFIRESFNTRYWNYFNKKPH